MKEQDEFEPLIIRGNETLTDPSTRLAIAKQTVKAVEFACEHRLKYIVACLIMSPTVGGLSMVTSLAMDDTDYIENLEGCLSTLEENEEYELCAKVLELKKIIPTVKFVHKKLKKSIVDAITDL
jgi:hypothetical protein